jgi:hypothetical protein
MPGGPGLRASRRKHHAGMSPREQRVLLIGPTAPPWRLHLTHPSQIVDLVLLQTTAWFIRDSLLIGPRFCLDRRWMRRSIGRPAETTPTPWASFPLAHSKTH